MADPALQEPYDNPGHQPSEVPGQERLKAIEGGGKTSPPNRNWYGDTPQPKALSEGEKEATSDSAKPDLKLIEGGQHPNQAGKGYAGEGSENLSLRGRLKARRKLLIGLGASGAITLLIVGGIFSFLNTFKLDHLMSNIDARTFSRLNGVADRRSIRWMQAYMEMRMADIGGDNHETLNLDGGKKSDNLFFRSEQVSTGSPTRDWYRTMRTSKFEQEVFEKHGFKFVSVAYYENGQVKIRPGKITLNGKLLPSWPSNGDWTDLEKGKTDTLRKFRDGVDLEKFGNNKEARQAIREAVKNETHFFQVYKRRHVRKAIQNMTGVRDWRFFEDTRNKLDEKKIEVRNKILDKAIPSNLKSGQILRCLFGIDECRYSRDAADSVNQDAGREANKISTQVDTVNSPVDGSGKPVLDSNNKPKTTKLKVDTNQISKDTAELAAKIGAKLGSSLNAFTAAVNITGTLEMLSHIDSGMKHLGKVAVVAKGVQAMGLYQVFETSRDQIKSGQVQAAEVNKFMQVIGPITASEGFTKVIANQGDPSKLTATPASKDYCSDKSQADLQKDPSLGGKGKFSFAYLCPDKQIGGSSNAQSIQAKYDATIGQVIGPIVKAYNGAQNIPIIGDIISATNQALNVLGNGVSVIVMGLLNGLGLGNDLKSVLTYVMGKLTTFLGGGPILAGTEWAGEFSNWLVQGGAYTAETTARVEGGSLTTPQSKVTALAALHSYQQDEQAQMTAFDRLLSTSNPDSLASRSLFGITQLKFSSVSNLFTNLTQSFKSAFSALFFGANHKAAAADVNGYAGANFAGIETYDFPQQCSQPVRLDAQPIDGTNALDIFTANKIDINDPKFAADIQKLKTWDTETNSTDFYATIYKIITDSGHKNDADDIAVQIYNCNLLDTAVRGGLGYVYGYTKDNGLEDGSSTASTPATPGTAGPAPTTLNGYTLTASESKWIQYIAQSVLPLLPTSPDDPATVAARVTWWSLREADLREPNPIAYSNCNDKPHTNPSADFTQDCPSGLWQVGIAGVQVPDNVSSQTIADLEAKAKSLHSGMSIDQILGQMSTAAGFSQGSEEYNTVISSTGRKRASFILRDSVMGFVSVYPIVRDGCTGSNWVDWCHKNGYPPADQVARDSGTAQSVIKELAAYFQGSSTTSTPGSSGTGGGKFTNPFPGGWIPNRLDMGSDGTFSGQIVAPFDGTITYAGPFTGWNGSLGIIIKADNDVGLPTRSLFFTEGVGPIVSSGQHVTAGTPIANPVPSPYGDAYGHGANGAIEWGVSKDGPIGQQVDTEAIALGNCSAAAKQMVLNFAQWFEQKLSVASPSSTDHAGCA